ncbi:hypothetical protein DD599_25790 [Enterobacter cloacae complex sp. CH23B]|nr:hypothetical protein DD599_25790 [Enterobacter cloacae complex sp. CH23B]
MREGKSLTGNQNFHGQESGATLKATGAEALETLFAGIFFSAGILWPDGGRKVVGKQPVGWPMAGS